MVLVAAASMSAGCLSKAIINCCTLPSACCYKCGACDGPVACCRTTTVRASPGGAPVSPAEALPAATAAAAQRY